MSDEILDGLDIELFDVPRLGPGRQPATVTMEFDRELTSADLKMPPVQVQTNPSIKKIKDTHHALARVLATGSKEAEASLITGYSLSRISILKADPQFQDLLEFYRSGAIEAQAEFKDRMAMVGMSALSELAERLEEEPEKMSTGLLLDVATKMADRTGHAPGKVGAGGGNGVTVNISLRDTMAQARERVNALRAAQAPKAPVVNSMPVIEHDL